MTTINLRAWRVLAVLVTFITDWPFSTVGVFWVVTTIIDRIEHGSLWVITTMGAEQVLWFGVLTETMPERSAVELIFKPSWA